MISKTFEIRDAGTFIPVLAVKLIPLLEKDRYLLSRAGFGRSAEEQADYVLLCRISGGGGNCQSDYYEWGGAGRTFQQAHKYISEHFDTLSSGQVIDVEFILGESTKPKISEQEESSANGI